MRLAELCSTRLNSGINVNNTLEIQNTKFFPDDIAGALDRLIQAASKEKPQHFYFTRNGLKIRRCHCHPERVADLKRRVSRVTAQGMTYQSDLEDCLFVAAELNFENADVVYEIISQTENGGVTICKKSKEAWIAGQKETDRFNKE